MALEGLPVLSGGRIPQPDGAIAGSGGQQPAVGRELDGADRATMVLEGLLVLSGGRIPQPDGAIAGSGCQQPAVSGERDGADQAAVALEGLELRIPI